MSGSGWWDLLEERERRFDAEKMRGSWISHAGLGEIQGRYSREGVRDYHEMPMRFPRPRSAWICLSASSTMIGSKCSAITRIIVI